MTSVLLIMSLSASATLALPGDANLAIRREEQAVLSRLQKDGVPPLRCASGTASLVPGKYVVVVFWSPNCLYSLSALDEAARLRRAAVSDIAIALVRESDSAKPTPKTSELSHPWLMARDLNSVPSCVCFQGQFRRAWHADGTPKAFLFDPLGRPRVVTSGGPRIVALLRHMRDGWRPNDAGTH